MKKRYLLLLVICILITGCSNAKTKEESKAETNQPVEETQGNVSTGEDKSSEEDLDSKEEEKAEATVLERQIKEQSFDITLDGIGDVIFASIMPEEKNSEAGDVQFKLFNGTEEIYSFPGIAEDNLRPGQHFEKVIAVAFKDCNSDDKKDVVIINQYSSQNEDSYNEARVYIRGEKTEFSIDNYLVEFLNKNHYNDTIDSVMKGVAEYVDNTEGKTESDFYGDYLITALAGTAKVYAMSQEEIDEVIEDRISYQPGSYTWNGSQMDLSYKEESYSTDQFLQDFGIEASTLGIVADKITLVTTSQEGNFIGNHFYVVDENLILIYYEGVFFQAERVYK